MRGVLLAGVALVALSVVPALASADPAADVCLPTNVCVSGSLCILVSSGTSTRPLSPVQVVLSGNQEGVYVWLPQPGSIPYGVWTFNGFCGGAVGITHVPILGSLSCRAPSPETVFSCTL
jgi:hypothetical protein